MLKELRIENLAIIDELDISLDKGLTVLTGETGAGKSIILDGLSLIIGEKSDKSLIGKNSDKVSIEAVFDLSEGQISKLDESGYELDEELIVTREFGSDNKVKVNGKRFTLGSLKEISSNILDIVGQHDHQYLLNSNFHLSILDKFISTSEIKTEIKGYIDKISKLNVEIENIEKEKLDVIEKQDFYTFALNEIKAVNLKLNEDVELEEEYKQLFNAGSIIEKLETADNAFTNLNLNVVKKALSKLVEYGKDYQDLYERFESVYDELNDIAAEVGENLADVDNDPFRLDEVVSRLDKIKKLKKKYGDSVEKILNHAKNLEEKLELLEFSSEILEQKKKEKNEILKLYDAASLKLSSMRKEEAKKLEVLVKNELRDLNMNNVEFEINFEKIDRINVNGYDNVKFLISTNKGEKLKDLSKIASGGEISRIMLALKIVFSRADNISCLIFDEIDTGISGETVIKIANKLKQLSENVQIICVTHSPQIAAKANTQYLIYKEIENNTTHTRLKKLNYEQRMREIARILSGDNISKASLDIAKEMMK